MSSTRVGNMTTKKWWHKRTSKDAPVADWSSVSPETAWAVGYNTAVMNYKEELTEILKAEER